MSSRTARVQQTSQQASPQTAILSCDHCHTKPRFGTHLYCGKNCAAQAASLCRQCHVKPKHGTHDFCGKKCAALANAGKPSASLSGVGTITGNTKVAANQPQPAAASLKGVVGSANGNGYPAKRGGKPPLAPGITQYSATQQAPFISTSLPVPFQVAPLLNHIQSLATTALSNISNLPSAPANGHSGFVPASSSVNETLAVVLDLPAKPAQAEPYSNGQHASYPTSQYPPAQQLAPLQTQAPAAQAEVEYEDKEEQECRIPGCGQPVHETSEYCSTRHREEAVTSRLEEACIMCLKLPQTETDYFCGRICREEALSKLVEV